MFPLALAASFFAAAHAAGSSLVASSKQLQPEFQKLYAEYHKKHVPSPQDLATKFYKKQRAVQKAKAEKKEFLKSPAHKLEMERRAHKEYQEVRRQSNTSGDNLPAEAMSVTMSVKGHNLKCGDHVPLKDLGIMDNAFTRAIFWDRVDTKPHHALLQGGPSMAVPGAGATQKMADNGRSKEGTITSAEKWEEVTPMVKVFKDGWSLIGCFKDQMHEFGDKFGDNYDQYRQENLNVSIVKYSEVVLRENQVAMTPKKCYEFCRTVPDMVYFGVTGGRDCYCMPFYQHGASGSDNCDLPCEGDPKQMCGGKEKSSMFEMHMCQDTAGDLLYNSVKAEMELVYFYDTAFMTDKLGKNLEKGGKLLQKVAGSVGDMGASALGKAALTEAASLFDPNTGWGVCRPQYAKLIDLYIEAKELYEADFTFAKELQQAEDTMMMMDNLRKKLHKCAEDAEGPILAVYPFYFGFMASLDETELQAKTDKYIDGIVGFYPAIYMMDQFAPQEMSSCKGEMLGLPKPLPFSSCAESCDQITRPARCAGFQYFQFMDGDTQVPLCFHFMEMKEVRTYRCTELRGTGLVLDQEEKAKKAFRSKKIPGDTSLNICEKVRMARKFSMLSCESIFGKASKVIEECPDDCQDTEGAANTAVCMARHSLGNPRLEHHPIRRCFGENKKTSQANADWRLQEFGVDASGGAGPKIEGEIKMAGSVVREPYGHVWTPGPAGQR
jgi:hypothetical protein